MNDKQFEQLIHQSDKLINQVEPLIGVVYDSYLDISFDTYINLLRDTTPGLSDNIEQVIVHITISRLLFDTKKDKFI